MSYLRSERCRESQNWGRQRTLTIGATTSRHFTNRYFYDFLTTVKCRPPLTALRHGLTLLWDGLVKTWLDVKFRRAMCRSSLSGRRTRLKTPTSSLSTIFPTSNRYWKKRHPGMRVDRWNNILRSSSWGLRSLRLTNSWEHSSTVGKGRAG